jgi:hypothetical protein
MCSRQHARIVVVDPEVLKDILVRRPDLYDKSALSVRMLDELLRACGTLGRVGLGFLCERVAVNRRSPPPPVSPVPVSSCVYKRALPGIGPGMCSGDGGRVGMLAFECEQVVAPLTPPLPRPPPAIPAWPRPPAAASANVRHR